MPPINVAAIRIEHDHFLVWRKRPLLRFAFSIRRPLWRLITVHARRQKFHSFCFNVINANKAVIVSRGSECQLFSIGRPFHLPILSARNNLHRFRASVQRGNPNLPVTRVRNPSPRRSLRRMPCVNFLGLAATPFHRPNRLLHTRWIASRIRILPRWIFPTAAHINQSLSIRRKTQRRKLLSIIFEIRSQPPRLELRPFRHPNVSLPLFIQRPRNAIVCLRRDQIRRKRRAQRLLQRESLLRLRTARHKNKNQQQSAEPPFHLMLLFAIS